MTVGIVRTPIVECVDCGGHRHQQSVVVRLFDKSSSVGCPLLFFVRWNNPAIPIGPVDF